MARFSFETDLKSRTLLYTFSAFLVSIALLLFAVERSRLSPYTKIYVLSAVSVGSYLGGRVIGNRLLLDTVSSVALSSAVIHLWLVYSPGIDSIFVVMVSVAAVVAVAAYFSDRVPDNDYARFALAGIALSVLLAGAVDIYGGQPNYVLNLNDQISPGDSSAGTLVAQNSFFLPRNAEIPSYRTCDSERIAPVFIDVERDRTLLAGDSVEQYDLEITSNRLNETRKLEIRDSCPSGSPDAVVLVERENRFD